MKRCMIFVAMAMLVAFSVAAQQGVNESRPAPADGTVTIRNPAGSVTVLGWDRKEIRVEGTLGKNVKRLELDTGRRSSAVRVVVPRFAKRQIDATLTVCVPAGSALKVETVSATVKVSKVLGSLTVESVSGAVTVADKPAAVSVETVSGDVAVGAETAKVSVESTSGDLVIHAKSPEVDAETVSGAIRFTGSCARFEAESVSGDIQAEGVGGHLDVETMSGDVRLACPAVKDGDVESMSGMQSVTAGLAPNGELSLESHSGRVELTLAGNPPKEIHVKTFSGNLKTSLPMTLEAFDESHSGRDLTLVGTGDKASGSIALRTFSGDIRLKQMAAE